MSEENVQPIVIKRVKKGGGAAHGGAWKIAYADFVTAMMAFFLLMWLLGSTAKGDLAGISQHFQSPMKVSMSGGSGAGDATSIIQGGGTDLSRSSGQAKKGESPEKPVKRTAREIEEEFERLQKLKETIEKAIESIPKLAQFKNQLLLDITREGLRIQIVDEKNRPMFDLSSAELKPYTRDILREIGKILNDVENRLSLAGHTDATSFAQGVAGFSNWELSANRANASRREMVLGGMSDTKVLRVVGLASSVLFDRNDPLNPVNRRISIVVLNKETEESILQEEGPEIDLGSASETESAAQVSAAGAPASQLKSFKK